VLGVDVGMMARIARRRAAMGVVAATSPLNCAWIRRGSTERLAGEILAVCLRSHEAERIVTERECAECPLWEQAFDVPSQDAGLAPSKDSPI
jgi:hypothetical protein